MAVLGLAACGGAQRSDPSPARPETKGTSGHLGESRPSDGTTKVSTRRATLRYEVRGRRFPLPVVSGTIAGHPVVMLVDTGANSHVVAGWVVRKLGLPMKKLGDIGSDHVGKSIATYSIDKLEMTIDGWGPLATTTVLATEIPEAIEKLGIGAFISPQHLDEEGDATILDLAKGELRSAWWDEADRELGARGTALVSPDQSRACEENGGPVKGLAFVVPATIESHEVQLLVDTGAQHSDVFATSIAGKKLAQRSKPYGEPMYTAAGKISARRLKDALITTGSFAVRSNIDLIEGKADASCPRDGVLAMDVLRSCVLIFDGSQRSRIRGSCLPAR
jgi:hypothetical protein